MTDRTYVVNGMDCANCAREIEQGVAKLSGINSVEVNFATGIMKVDGEASFEALKERVEALGKTVVKSSDDASEQPAPLPKGVAGFWRYMETSYYTRATILGGGIIIAGFALSVLSEFSQSAISVLYVTGMILTLYPILRSGLNTLRINHEFSINLLMSIAAVGAILIGEHFEGAAVIFLFAIGEALEGYTVNRARDSVHSLMSLKPAYAIKLTGGREDTVHVNDLQIGDMILVKPFEHIPMDGIVQAGHGNINQAPITGESVPVYKEPGDEVYAGSINGEGTLEIRSTSLAKDNTISRIIKLVEEAQSARAPSQRLVDRFAHYYTPVVVLLAVMVAVLPPLLFNAPFMDTPEQRGWLYRALSMLVIACPCALVISTPVTVISAITAAARNGVLIKGGAFLERLGVIKAIAFDKTGTLTEGRPQVVSYRDFSCEASDFCGTCGDILAMASAVERRSAHPLADAVVLSAEERRLDDHYAPAENVMTFPGRGVQGQVGENLVTIGSHRFFDAAFPHRREICELVEAAETRGRTTMLLSQDEHVRGMIELIDAPRQSSAALIQQLNDFNIATIMLTGDNELVADAIGGEIGVRDVRANLMPEDKVQVVDELIGQYKHVAMVGDGINDTPALSKASIGIAMGGAGSKQVLETADVVLMADDLRKLPFVIRLSRFARSVIIQNIVLSLLTKLVFLLLAFAGMTSLLAAIFADVGVSLIVILNGLRLLRFGGENTA